MEDNRLRRADMQSDPVIIIHESRNSLGQIASHRSALSPGNGHASGLTPRDPDKLTPPFPEYPDGGGRSEMNERTKSNCCQNVLKIFNIKWLQVVILSNYLLYVEKWQNYLISVGFCCAYRSACYYCSALSSVAKFISTDLVILTHKHKHTWNARFTNKLVHTYLKVADMRYWKIRLIIPSIIKNCELSIMC